MSSIVPPLAALFLGLALGHWLDIKLAVSIALVLAAMFFVWTGPVASASEVDTAIYALTAFVALAIVLVVLVGVAIARIVRRARSSALRSAKPS